MGTKNSAWKRVTGGVPQEPVLCSLLFILKVNYLASVAPLPRLTIAPHWIKLIAHG